MGSEGLKGAPEGFASFPGGFTADLDDGRLKEPGVSGDFEPEDWLRTLFSLSCGLGFVLGLPRGFVPSGFGSVTLSVGALRLPKGFLGLTDFFLVLSSIFFFFFPAFFEGLFRGTSSSSDNEDSEEDDDDGDDDNAGLDLRVVEVVAEVAARRAPGLEGLPPSFFLFLRLEEDAEGGGFDCAPGDFSFGDGKVPAVDAAAAVVVAVDAGLGFGFVRGGAEEIACGKDMYSLM